MNSTTAFLALALTLLASNHAFAAPQLDEEIVNLPEGQIELTDIMTPEQIYADALNAGSELDVTDLNAEETDATSSQAKIYILVSKAKQHLWVYEDGRLIPGWDWKVSTGTEQVRCPPAPAECRIAHTPTGIRHPGALDWEHFSTLYGMAPMHRAIQFVGGIYLHATYGDHIRNLGRRDSGGCVRQHPANAEKLFIKVRDVVKQLTRQAVLIEITEN